TFVFSRGVVISVALTLRSFVASYAIIALISFNICRNSNEDVLLSRKIDSLCFKTGCSRTCGFFIKLLPFLKNGSVTLNFKWWAAVSPFVLSDFPSGAPGAALKYSNKRKLFGRFIQFLS